MFLSYKPQIRYSVQVHIIKTVLETNTDLMDILTGGIYCDVEEISRQNTPAAFDVCVS